MASSRVLPGVYERRIKPVDVKQYGIQGYDADNKYPQRIKNTIAASGTGTACTKLFAKFLKGRGFADATVNAIAVNADAQPLSDILSLVSLDYSLFRGFALHVQYNALLEIISLKHIPFETIRINLPDDLGNVDAVSIHPDWAGEGASRFNPKDIKTVDFYTENASKIAAQIQKAGDFTKWNGHIYYYSEDGAFSYPKATCDPILEDVVTDSKIKTYKYRNTSNSFMPSHLLIKRGRSEDEDDIQDYIENINKFQGADNSHKILVVESDDEATDPIIKPFEAPTKDREFEYTENSTRENIIRAYGQPLVLHAVRTAGSLGESTEWEDAKKNYDERTEEERDRVELALAKIVMRFKPELTREQMKIIPITGLTDKAPRAVLATQLGANGVQSLQSIIADAGIQPAQKINILIIVFGLSAQDADALVNGTPIPQA